MGILERQKSSCSSFTSHYYVPWLCLLFSSKAKSRTNSLVGYCLMARMVGLLNPLDFLETRTLILVINCDMAQSMLQSAKIDKASTYYVPTKLLHTCTNTKKFNTKLNYSILSNTLYVVQLLPLVLNLFPVKMEIHILSISCSWLYAKLVVCLKYLISIRKTLYVFLLGFGKTQCLSDCW